MKELEKINYDNSGLTPEEEDEYDELYAEIEAIDKSKPARTAATAATAKAAVDQAAAKDATAKAVYDFTPGAEPTVTPQPRSKEKRDRKSNALVSELRALRSRGLTDSALAASAKSMSDVDKKNYVVKVLEDEISGFAPASNWNRAQTVNVLKRANRLDLLGVLQHFII
jgi:hypothetical protein